MHWRRDAWLLVLLAGTGLFLLLERALAATGDPALVPLALLAAAGTVPIAYAALIAHRRPRRTVPGWPLGGCALLAAGLGAAVAGALPYDALRDFGLVPLVVVSLFQELTKAALAAAVVLARLPFRRVTDGLLVGVAVGVGYASMETVGYLCLAVADSAAGVDSIVHLVLVRGLLSPAGHLAWTGVVAAALWRAAQDGWSGRALRRLVIAFGAAVTVHALWSAAATPLVHALLSAGSFAFLCWFTLLTTRTSGRRNRAGTSQPAKGALDPAPTSPVRASGGVGPRPVSPMVTAAPDPLGTPTPRRESPTLR